MNFINGFKRESSKKLSQNGAEAYSSTGSNVLNLFSSVGNLRNVSDEDIRKKFLSSYAENPKLTSNIVLYTRSIRDGCGGLGERRVGRILLQELSKVEPQTIINNFKKIVDIGRFDDLYSFISTPVEKDMWNFIRECWAKDTINMRANKPISLMAKWLKSVNTSSEESRQLGRKTARELGLPESTYRKCLSAFRKYLNVLEVKMSAKEWGAIEYSQVCSLAMNKYRTAFYNHDEERFQQYIEEVKNGNNKINSSVLYPHDIVRKFFKDDFTNVEEAQWKALPNYVEGNQDILCLCDVSGSMMSPDYIPISASIGLGIYFAERNQGAYKNLYLTFTDDCNFIEIDPTESLYQKIQTVRSAGIGYSTNLDLAFSRIFEVAKRTNDVPQALIVLSDMEINNYVGQETCSIVEKWEQKYEEIGLKMPKLILWNLESGDGINKTYLDQFYNPNISYISGYSSSTFSNMCTLMNYSAYEAMEKILEQNVFQWEVRDEEI